MIEKDNIQELFSKAFENQTATVRPELWAGVQAKMAAAGVASTATVASKGLSALTKWIIGSAAVGTVGVVTAVVALNSGQETADNRIDSKREITQNVVAEPEESLAAKEIVRSGNYTEPNATSGKPFMNIQKETNNNRKENKELISNDLKLREEIPAPANRKAETKPDDRKNHEIAPKTGEDKKTNSSVSAGETSKPATNTDAGVVNEPHKKHYPEDTKEPVFVKLESKVTKFPNVFTPNGDRSNDIYFVEAENINEFQLVIIDQNNREMFRSNNPGEHDGWNGRDKSGEEAPNGSYAAIVTGKDQNGKSFRDIQLFELRR